MGLTQGTFYITDADRIGIQQVLTSKCDETSVITIILTAI